MNKEKFKRGSIFNFVLKEWKKELDDKESLFYRRGRVVLRLFNKTKMNASIVSQLAVLIKQAAMNEEIFCYTTRELAVILEKYQQAIQRAMVNLINITGIKFIVVKIPEIRKAGIKIKNTTGYGRWIPLPPRTPKEKVEDLYEEYYGLVVRDIPVRGRRKRKWLVRKNLRK